MSRQVPSLRLEVAHGVADVGPHDAVGVVEAGLGLTVLVQELRPEAQDLPYVGIVQYLLHRRLLRQVGLHVTVLIDDAHVPLLVVLALQQLPVANDQARLAGQGEVAGHGENGVVLLGAIHQHGVVPQLLPGLGGAASEVLHVLEVHVRHVVDEGMVGDGPGLVHHPLDEDGQPIRLIAARREHRGAGDELVRKLPVQHTQLRFGRRLRRGLRRRLRRGLRRGGDHRGGHGGLGYLCGRGGDDHLSSLLRRGCGGRGLMDEGHLRGGGGRRGLRSSSVALRTGDEEQGAEKEKDQRAYLQQRVPPFGIFMCLLYRICATKKRIRYQQIMNKAKTLPNAGRAFSFISNPPCRWCSPSDRYSARSSLNRDPGRWCGSRGSTRPGTDRRYPASQDRPRPAVLWPVYR